MSKCESCSNLTVWPGVFGGARYLCDERRPSPKQFGKFGRSTVKGYPPVTTCDKYKDGRHYSVRDLLRNRESKS
jgi:hypothetical protein